MADGYSAERSAKALEVVKKSRSTQRPQRPQRRDAQGFLSGLCELCVQTSHFFTGSLAERNFVPEGALVNPEPHHENHEIHEGHETTILFGFSIKVFLRVLRSASYFFTRSLD